MREKRAREVEKMLRAAIEKNRASFGRTIKRLKNQRDDARELLRLSREGFIVVQKERDALKKAVDFERDKSKRFLDVLNGELSKNARLKAFVSDVESHAMSDHHLRNKAKELLSGETGTGDPGNEDPEARSITGRTGEGNE